jgi:NTE family protein
MSLLDTRLDLYELKRGFERANGTLDVARAAADLSFLRHARRALIPLPVVDRPATPVRARDVLPPFERHPVRGLRGARIALVAGGGGGACVSLLGAWRAFEESGIEPELVVGCSGGNIWSSMWCAGMTAEEATDFSLSWRPEQYLDIQWQRLPGFALSALRGFSGIMAGEAMERLFDDRFGSMPVGELAIPLSAIVYDMDRGLIDYFGTRETPEVPLGRLIRIAIGLPLFIEAAEVRGHLYVDGGIIDLMPVGPILDDGGFDHVFHLNFMLPPQLEPEDITGWIDSRMGVLKASRQLEQGYHLYIARRTARELGDRLTIIDPSDHTLLRGVSFYDIFIDRRTWPQLIRTGYERTRAALDAFSRARTAKRRAAATPNA